MAKHRSANNVSSNGPAWLKISGIAEAITQTSDIHGRMQEGGFYARKLEAPREGAFDAAIDFTEDRFEEIENAVYEREQALTALLLHLEPETLDETLSLALVFAHELDGFISDNTPHQQDPKVERMAATLEHALDAIIRGLVHAQAKSPLLEDFSTPAKLMPRQQEEGFAIDAAAKLAATKGATHD